MDIRYFWLYEVNIRPEDAKRLFNFIIYLKYHLKQANKFYNITIITYKLIIFGLILPLIYLKIDIWSV